MNLIIDPWIPIIRANGVREKIAPWQIAESENPIIEIDAPRPDFQGALYQLLIGLLQTTFAPDDTEQWSEIWQDGLDPDELKLAFEGVAAAFELYNENGPAFMQDFDLPNGEVKSVAALLIEAPGGKTVKDNLDHFVKRDRVEVLCPSCTASALFTLQTNAPSGGVGHRVGLRGGGPLTTLVMPQVSDAPLWQKLWLNVIDLENAEQADTPLDADIFPWLAATRLSDKKGSETTPDSVHALQAYWGMPRRIRLQTMQESCTCDICGELSEYCLVDYRTKNYGVNYDGAWIHSLTPYRFDPKKKNLPLSLKGQQGGLGYRHWLGMVFQDAVSGDTSAKITRVTMEERADELGDNGLVRLWCFGFDMDNMKARCWYDTHFPLFRLDETQRENLLQWAAELIQCAKDAASLLRKYTKEAWFRRPSDIKGDMNYINADFWQRTETDFYALLHQFAELPADTAIPSAIYKQWLSVLHRELFDAFDRWVLEANPEDLDMKRIVLARDNLRKKFYGAKAVKTIRQRSQTVEDVA